MSITPILVERGRKNLRETTGADIFNISIDAVSVTIAGNMRSGDVINIEGLASEYRVSASGRTFTLRSDTQVIKFQLATTNGSASVRFADGDLTATYNNRVARLGDQKLKSKLVAVDDSKIGPLDSSEVTFTSASGSGAGSVVQSYAITAPTSLSEGETATYTIKTTGVTAGTLLSYSLTGTGNAAANTASGVATVDSDGFAIVSTKVATNSAYADTGTLKLDLVNGKASSGTLTVTDTTVNPRSIPGIFALIAGVDGITGSDGNDTFVGTYTNGATNGGTFTVGDSLDGGLGTDTLKVVVSDGGVLAPVTNLLLGTTIDSIETLSVQNAGGQTVNVNLSGTSVSSATALNGLSKTAFTKGASGTTFTASGSATVANVDFAMATSTAAVSVAVDGGVNNITMTNTAGAPTAATISSTGAANGFGTAGANTFMLTSGTAATVNTLAVKATANLKATLTAGDFVTTGAALSVSGAATKVDLGTAGVFKTINASGLSAGGLTLTTAGTGIVSSIVGGAGNDEITLLTGSLTASATANLGAGHDTLKGSATLSTMVTVDGGDGTDYISTALVNVSSAANIKNFEGLDVTGFNSPLDATLLTNSTIANIQFSGDSAQTSVAVIQNVAAAGIIQVTGAIDQAAVQTANLGSLTLTQASTPSLAINFAAAPGIAATTSDWYSSLGTVKQTGNTSVTINSNGDAYTKGNGIAALHDTTNKLTTVTIAGATAFALDEVKTYVGNTTIAATTASSLTTIDGSAATGKLTITAGADNTVNGQSLTYTGLTIRGGSADDTITMQAKNGVVYGGGGSDTIKVDEPVASSTSNVVTVYGGTGSDTLKSTLAYGATASASSSNTTGNSVLFADAASGDVIQFATVANSDGALGTKTSVTGAATFDQAVFLAESGSANTVTWFQYAGNTYVQNSGAAVGAGNSTDNIVIRLSGLVDLSGAEVLQASDTITLA